MHVALLLLFGLLAFTASTSTQSAEAPRQVQLNIEAQPLDQALMLLGKQTGLTIAIDPNAGIENVFSPGLTGRFIPADALQKLLASTGFQAEPMSEKAFMVTALPRVEKPRNDQDDSRNRASSVKLPAHSDTSASKLSEVEVTGSHIRGVPPDVSPLISYSRLDIDGSGAFTTEDLVRQFPQNFSRVNAQTTTGNGTSLLAANNVAHGDAVELFGLGPGGTLVLFNGHRVPLSGHDGSIVDVSLFPLSAVDHVDILTDGASAIYGADAIAGVVNFVLRSDFVGLETTPYYGDTTGGGGRELGISQLAGDVWSSGGVLLAYENYHQQAVNAWSRDNLVAGPGPYQVVPSQSRQSAVLTAHQDLAAGTDVAMEAFYSGRDFAQEYVAVPFIDTRSDGNTRIFGGSVSAGIRLPRDWRSSLSAGISEEQEQGATSAATIQQLFETRSEFSTIDWRSDGSVYPAPGGAIKLSTGISWRREGFNDLMARLGPSGAGLERDILGLFAEMWAPIIGEGNAQSWAQRLELSLAVRRDTYENRDAGLLNARAVNPKIAVLWSPGAGFAFRGTYATSFRVAPLAQMGSTDKALLLPFSNPNTEDAPINSLYLTGGNSALRPELATSFTAGLDWKPDSLDGWSVSGTYFHIRYHDRIATPPVVGSVTGVFSQLATLAPYINASPSAADIQAVYNRYGVLDPTQIGQAGVQAIFDGRDQNIASLEASGVEATANAKVHTPSGDLSFRLDGQYLKQLANQAAPTTSYVSVVSTVFNPPELRFGSRAWWTYQRWLVGITANYTSSFTDTLVPSADHAASWLVMSTRVSYSIAEPSTFSTHRKTTVSVSVNDFTNRAPPRVASVPGRPLNYDPSNASPLGREVVFELKQSW